MLRSVSSLLRWSVLEPVEAELQVAVASGHRVDEELVVELDGRRLEVAEHAGPAGGRLHLLRAGAGELVVRYRAQVLEAAPPAVVEPLDRSTYLRPSRYAESDRLGPLASAELGALPEADRLRGVADWVNGRLAYVSGASRPTDGAVDTLLSGEGVCRDFAHLTVALLRALDVPARLVSVYAPGLHPMDFHAVVEALVDGAWQVVDATRLAPRQSLVRVASGRDAADTAFLTTTGGTVRFDALEVLAVVEGPLPVDDVTAPARLG